MRVLLTNDDGILAPGLRTLAAQLACHCDVLVVAPENASSASSHTITLHKPLRLTELPAFSREIGAVPCEVRAFTCSGRPSDCATLGVLHLAKDDPVDLLISGINDGCNVAEDLTYSGTVGAALEGAILGVPSLAVSLDLDRGGAFRDAALLTDLLVAVLLYGGTFEWHNALLQQLPAAALNGGSDCRWSLEGLPRIGGERFPAHPALQIDGLLHTPALNVNIPGVPLSGVTGFSWTEAGHREYRDVVKQAADPRGRPYFWLGGDKVLAESERPGTDIHALLHGIVSVTPISYDITNRTDLPRFQRLLRERSGHAGSQE
jgi:5'-nucleotidase